MDWKFWLRSKDEYHLECERFIKYNGIKIDLSGLGFDAVQLGKIGIETTLLQAVSQALMLLDFSQYRLCKAVSNAPDDETRKKNYSLMIGDIARSSAICDALAGLSLSPESKELQSALKGLLISRLSRTEDRVIEIEKLGSQSQEKDQEALVSAKGIIEEKSIDVGSSSISLKFAPLKRSYEQLRDKQSKIEPKVFSQEEYLKIERLHSNIIKERNIYEETGNMVKMYESILPDLQELYRDKELMGNRNANLLRGISIRLGQLIQEFRPLEGTNTKDENDLKIKIILSVEEIIELTDKTFSQLSDLVVRGTQ